MRLNQGQLPQLPTSPTQQVMIASDKRSARVTVTRTADRAADANATGPAAPKLKHTAAADGRDPRIKALTGEALEGVGTDPTVRAEALRRFVRRHIKAKDLSVGMATASEVARTRTGDCTEHAVLLAAMLRSAGIPARAASGLMYVDQFIGQRGVFGYHMWTQAWLDGRWVDLDAMLDDVAFDATHITLSVSDLDETGMTNDLVQMVPIIGNLQIDVLEVD
jgi:transglutaminase-like putative cysteine protease